MATYTTTTSFAGGTLSLTYDSASDSYTSKFTLPDGKYFQTTLTGDAVAPTYGAGYKYNETTKQLTAIDVNADPQGFVITDAASLSSFQQYVDAVGARRTAINQLYNNIQSQKKAAITNSAPPPIDSQLAGSPAFQEQSTTKPATVTNDPLVKANLAKNDPGSLVPSAEPKKLSNDPQLAKTLAKNDPGSLVPTLEPKKVTDAKGAPAAPGTSASYTVQKGDTLTSIAKKYGVTVPELLKANPSIKDPNLIKVGQVITIPGKPSSPAAAPGTDPAKPETGTVAPSSPPPSMGLTSGIRSAAGAATAQDQANFAAREDWRVRLSLAPGSNYLYNAQDPGILQPLKPTDGVIFPYTPSIQVNYAANYEGTSLTHTNYKIFQYQNSSVDQVQLTCEFTAQDVAEANYVLAVIHFFRTMTKMFYGQDSNPKNGTPPPLCYLYGMGGYQFDALPLAISGFSYSLPQDVDYIKTTGASPAGTAQPSVDNGATYPGRLGGNIAPGGKPAPPNYGTTPTSAGESTTWIPTKINLSITCVPILSRNQVSNYFSLTDYATGKLLEGTKRPGGGMW